MMPKGKPAFCAFESCQVPFSLKAVLPAANSCQLVVCVSLITEFGAYPALSQPVHKARAAAAPEESSLVRFAPAPQNHGSNWKVPSSVPIAEKVIPFLPAAFAFASAAVSEPQSLTEAGLTPAALRMFLL